MAKAPVETPLSFEGYPSVTGGIVRWPMSVIRLKSENKEDLIGLSDKILGKWRAYTDESAVIYAETDGEMHNTITPITRKRDGLFEIDLVLRNNLTTPEHPDGLYHPWQELHHIKKENIGLIEVMGLAILPGRLNTELKTVADCLISGGDPEKDESIRKHAAWVAELREKYGTFSPDTVGGIVREEVGLVFKKVLECSGVFKRTEEGKAAFLRFTESI
jgi:UDPglucose--hexose-1-phosphate uridylyltransferase